MASEKTFAGRLKEERERKGLSIYALAKSSGMSKQALGKLEAGKRQPAWDTVQVIAKALGVSCEVFVDASIELPKEKPAKPVGRPRKVEPKAFAKEPAPRDPPKLGRPRQVPLEPPAKEGPVKKGRKKKGEGK